MDSVGAFEKPIKVDLPEIGTREFHRAEPILEWAQKEVAFWTNVRDALGKQAPFAPSVKIEDFVAQSKQLRESTTAYLAAGDAQKVAAKDAMEAALRKCASASYLSSETFLAQQITRLAGENPAAAWVALLVARGGYKTSNKQPDNLLKSGDIIDVIQFMSAWDVARADGFDPHKAMEAAEAQFASQRSRWEGEFSAALMSADKRRAFMLRRADRVKCLSLNMLRQYRTLQKDHQAQMETMRKAFSTDMRLRAAEKFWSAKRRVNRKRSEEALRQLWWIGGIGLAVLLEIYWALVQIFETPKEFNLTHTIIFFVPTLLFVWLLKIFATEYRSNKGLADDAEEREAMVMTFKALEFENRVGEQERLVILNALFRPHGASAEESIPAPLWEIMSRMKP